MSANAHFFADACAAVELALTGEARREIAAAAAAAPSLRQALQSLRRSMRSHAWTTPTGGGWTTRSGGAPLIDLSAVVKTYDQRTRQEGFHALHDWDGKADRVNEETIPVDVLDYIVARRGDDRPEAACLAILIDYYFLHVLSLLSLRIWDEGDADDNLDRLEELRQVLEGEQGSGQRFVDDAETLILFATSHYELAERGFGLLLERARTLNERHQARIALGHAASLGSHLRFGFEATCARDTLAMRDDNVADYPWLCFSLAALMREYARSKERRSAGRVVEALLNGLTPDARAFIGDAPASLSRSSADLAVFSELFHEHRDDLIEQFAGHRPSDRTYSPLSFYFNFAHNVVKGTVIDALLWDEPWRVSFNDLLTGDGSTTVDRDDHGSSAAEASMRTKHQLASTLMGYARANPDTIRGRLMPVIVYDPEAGRQAFSITMRKLREPTTLAPILD